MPEMTPVFSQNRSSPSSDSRAFIATCLLLVVTCLLLGPAVAHGQASSTASKDVGFSVFGAYSRVNPDYGSKGNGYVFGGEANRHYRFFDPALELRYSSFSKSVKESNLVGNLKLEKPLGRGGRFVPYIDGGFGYGVIHYPSNFRDSTITKDLGAGLDIGLIHHLGAKLDYQYSLWDFGGLLHPQLTPSAYTVGVVYQFHTGMFHR